MKITIIGTGNMGGAIALGLAKSSLIETASVTCVDLSQSVLQQLLEKAPELTTSTNSVEAIQGADIIIMVVKPWIIESAINEIKAFIDPMKQQFVSVVAGVSFEQLHHYFMIDGSNKQTPTLFRLIPNTAIEVRESCTLIASCNATAEDEARLLTLFNDLGTAILIPEKQMTAGTAIASCGIAFAMRYVRAATVGSVELGFSPAQAQQMVMQTMQGAVELLKANGSHPEVEIDKVTTPGGITIKGLNRMEKEGFTDAVIQGLKASN